MSLKLWLHRVTDGAVVADGAIIPLVLQRLNAVPVSAIFVERCRIDGMGAAVAGFAHHGLHLVVAIAVQALCSLRPGVEGIRAAARTKIFVTGQAVGFIDPWGPWLDFVN